MRHIYELIMVILTLLPFQTKEPVYDLVDVIELNHSYDMTGRLIFDQIIYWRWWSAKNQYVVVDYAVLHGCRKVLTTEELAAGQKELDAQWEKEKNPPPAPRFNPPFIGHAAVPHKVGMNYVSIFIDSRGILRKVISISFKETHTQNDPELENRVLLMPENRQLLNGKRDKIIPIIITGED